MRSNHPDAHFIIFLRNKVSFAFKTKQKNLFTKRVKKCKVLNRMKNFNGGKLPQKKLQLYKMTK